MDASDDASFRYPKELHSGKHDSSIDPFKALLTYNSTYNYICQVLYACAIAFTKIAVVASYLRFIRDGKFRITMYLTAIVIVGLWFTGEYQAVVVKAFADDS